MTQQYSTVQKLSLAGMVIGAILCLVGVCSPYWITSDPQGFGEFDLAGNVVKGSLGLFICCIELLGQKKCEAIEPSNDSGWFHSAQVGASVCVLLGIISAGIAMCLACCTCCKRFIVVGIVSFVAAASGAYCIIVFSRNTETITGSIAGFQVTSYGWAYYMFIGGVALLGVVSFTACFSAPDNPIRGMVLSQPAPSQVVVSSSSTTTMGQHPYMHLQEQGGPVMMGPTAAASSGVTVVTANGY